jgi:predicted nuclease with RNAse H fold
MDRTWVGADPGGKGRFGLAVIQPDGVITAATFDCADAATDFACQCVKDVPAGVGVDAPLWWSSGPSGDRCADQWLRKTYGLPGGQVQTANSLQGAALVQGAMFVARIRERFPRVPVTECHPKALLRVLAGASWVNFAGQYDITVSPRDENVRDAIIAAVAARETFSGRWGRDLARMRANCEQDPSTYWLSPVHYGWPDT